MLIWWNVFGGFAIELYELRRTWGGRRQRALVAKPRQRWVSRRAAENFRAQKGKELHGLCGVVPSLRLPHGRSFSFVLK